MSCPVQVHLQDLSFCLDGKNSAFSFKSVIVPRMFFFFFTQRPHSISHRLHLCQFLCPSDLDWVTRASVWNLPQRNGTPLQQHITSSVVHSGFAQADVLCFYQGLDMLSSVSCCYVACVGDRNLPLIYTITCSWKTTLKCTKMWDYQCQMSNVKLRQLTAAK